MLNAWQAIPRRARRAIVALPSRELSRRGGPENWSVREYVHHLVEANLVASTIVLAALGRPGTRYDWSWLVPGARWMKRIGYARAPVEPALRLLDAVTAHVAGLVRRTPRGMARRVALRGSTGTTRRTVRQLLEEETAHARHHLRDVEAIRAKRA